MPSQEGIFILILLPYYRGIPFLRPIYNIFEHDLKWVRQAIPESILQELFIMHAFICTFGSSIDN